MKRLSFLKKPTNLFMGLVAVASLYGAPRAMAQCTPAYSNNCIYDDYISNVTFNTINRSSVCEGSYVNTAQSTTVAPGSSHNISISVGYQSQGYTVWIDFNENNTFESSEVVFSANPTSAMSASGTVNIPASVTAGTKKMRVRIAYNTTAPFDPCNNYTYGEAEDYSVVVASQVANDAGITAITAPTTPFASGNQSVVATLKNFGNNELTSATINWTVNGVAQTPYSWSGSIASGASASVTLGTFNFMSGSSYSINATIGTANGLSDGNATNNSVASTLTPALSGTYTIGGTNPSFATFAAAAQTLNNGGMTGPVTFNVRAGTYTDQISLNEMIPGGGTAANPIVFQSENGLNTGVTLQYAATSSADNYVVKINGTDYVTIRNMTLSNTGASFGRVIHIQSTSSTGTAGSDNITIQGNVLNGRTSTSTSTEDAIIYAYGNDNQDNLVVTGNTINNGSLGLYTGGWYIPLPTGFRVENNTFQNAHVGGILFDYMDGATITGNTFIGKTGGLTTGYYIAARNSDNAVNIERNMMRGLEGGDGIILNATFSSTNSARIANNFIAIGAGTSNEADGITVLSRNGVNIYNNSINVTSTSTSSDAVEISSSTSVDMRNNILNNSGAGRAMNANVDFGTSNYNNLRTAGATLVSYMGTNYATLADWKAMGKDANSVSIMPMFASSTDLHLTMVNTQLFGLQGLTTTDIDNETRRVFYMGADEVIPTITINSQPGASSQGCLGSNTVLSVASTSTFGSQMSYQWQKNGSPIFDDSRFSGASTPTLTIRNTQPADAGIYAVRITDNSGATPVLSSTSNLIIDSPIEIARQPLSATICLGAETSLSVIANGTVRGIQWQKESPTAGGFVNIPGATTAQIFLTNATYNTSGKYRALVFGTCGTDTVATSLATVFVASPTRISRPVENQFSAIGGTATLTVEAEAAGIAPSNEPMYMWYRNGVALTDDARISGSNSSTLTINNLQSGDTSATYYVMVTGACGAPAQSNTARIFVPGLTITQAPQSVEVCNGANATLSVTASSSVTGSNITYQWMRNGQKLNNGGNISGATTGTLTITGVSAADVSAQYTAIITSQPGNVQDTTAPVSVNLKAATAISAQPTAQSVCEGSPLDLGVTAAGAGLTYEWRMNGTAIPGATNATYTVPSASMAMAGSYSVIVRGDCGEVTSSTVEVAVRPATAITQQPTAVSQNQYNTLTLSVGAAGAGTLSYQWLKDGSNIPGATTATYTKTDSRPSDAGRYSVIITGECGSVTSNEVIVSISTSIADIPAAGYSVAPVMPNPVSEAGQISFILGNSEQAKVTITDMFGREIAVVYNGFVNADQAFSVSFNTVELNMTAGVYMYTVSTPTFRATLPMVIVR